MYVHKVKAGVRDRERELTGGEVERQILQIQLLIRRQEDTEDDSVQLKEENTREHTDAVVILRISYAMTHTNL